ncbi:hypothetical protein FRC07_013265, partial [Ceratobasidium sp. 392]
MDAIPAGERWPVLLGTRAYGQLRQLHQRDQKVLKMVRGHIKLPADLRLIYLISVEPDAQNLYDRQVIKALRIEPKAHVNYQFWVKVARHLVSAQGKKYRKRCIYRLPGMVPAMFPASEYSGSPNSDADKYYEYEAQFDFEDLDADKCREYENRLDTEDAKDDQEEASKTTALIYKMRAINQSVEANNGNPARQLFVTRSRVLARHVESSFRGLTTSAELAYKTTEELHAIAERARQNPQRTLAEFDTELDLRDDLPASFSLLKDSHFPLFVSFDKLCALLEGDLPKFDSVNRRKIVQRPKIEFNEFYEKYWHRFKRQLTSAVDPTLAYSEIVGVIKGSSDALQSADGYLSLEQYTEKLPRRVLSQLPTQTRNVIYAIFEQYQRLKSQQYEWDHADRTKEILKYFSPNQSQHMIDYLYVDEVQDNLMLDVHLLRRLCPNIQGTYWGGDTAQTVVAGSAFRIKDLTAFVHDEIRDDLQRGDWTSPSSLLSIFSLTENFRSHSGIVDCAASIVELIYCLFPNSIDKLPTERARVPGPAPVLFTDSRNDVTFFESFVLGSSSDSRTGFGAQQAILVRSDATAEELDTVLDGLCPILTITDSKGLEFDDVLLYNFFSHSSVPLRDWRLISGQGTHKGSPEGLSNVSPALCIDLKMLYVAITRARKRCWIWDSGQIASEMKEFWLSRGLITISSSSTMIGRIGVSSTPEEWVEKGQEYFSRRVYKVAAVCFKQAGRMSDAKVALAYHQMTRAKLKFLRSDTEVSREGLIAAAHSMELCAEEASSQDARHYWFHSSSCWQLAGQFIPASEALLRGGFPTEAIELLLDNDLYEHGVPRLLANWDDLEPQTRDRLLDQCRKHYFETRDYRAIPRVFGLDVDAQLAYARTHGYIPQFKHLLRAHKRFDELAEILFNENSILAGVECIWAADEVQRDLSRLDSTAMIVVNHAHTVLLLEGQENEAARRDLHRAVALMHTHLDVLKPETQKSLIFLSAILNSGYHSLDVRATWDDGTFAERALKIVTFHSAITSLGWAETSSTNSLLEHLNAWQAHSSKILAIAEKSSEIHPELLQLLLGTQFSTSGGHLASRSIVFEDSLVLAGARRQKLDIIDGERAGEYRLRTAALDRVIESEIHARLEHRLRRLHSVLLHARLTRSPYRPKHAAGSTSEFEAAVVPPREFKRRLQIVAVTMSTLDPESPITEFIREDIAHEWVRRLHTLVYPLNGAQEDIFVLSSLPNHDALMQNMIGFLPAAVRRLDEPSHRRPQQFLTTLVAILSLAAILDSPTLDNYAEEHHLIHHYSGFFYLRTNQTDIEPPVPMDIVEFFRAESPDSLSSVVYTLHYILDSKLDMDAATMVHLVELITREMIYSLRAEQSVSQDGFSGSIWPRSWAKSLAVAWRREKPIRDTDELDELLRGISRLSFEFKFGSRRRWSIGEARLTQKQDVLHMLNMR